MEHPSVIACSKRLTHALAYKVVSAAYKYVASPTLGRSSSQAEIGKSGMIGRTRARRGPVKLAIRGNDRQIVDGGDTPAHQSSLVEFPVLISVRAEPVVGVVVPL